MFRKHTFYYWGFFETLLCGIASIVFSVSASAQTANFIAQNYPLLGNTHVAADFNGDGKLDLAGSGAKSADVMLGNGNGTFQNKISYPVADWTQDIAAGDFNSDGRIDLIVTINTQQTSLSLLTGNGNGTFNAPVNFANTSGSDSPSIVAADLNNDGRLDVVIMHTMSCYVAPCVAASTVSVMLGNGDGTFQPTRELPGGRTQYRMTIGDFNRDNIKDLAIGGSNTELHILLGIGDGTFNRLPTMTLIPGGDSASACNDVDVADFNRDAIQDLVVPLGNGYGNVVLLGNGDGTFRQSFRITENAIDAPFNLAVADYNGDGFQDVARAMGYGTRGLMEIANGNGDGTFQLPVRYLPPPPLSGLGGIFITANDFNGDGKPDVAMLVGGASASLNVLINSTGTTTPAPVTISSLVLSSSATTGGNSVTGTITLSARAQTATTVRLTSSNAAARVPASVTVTSGSSTANFTVVTTQVFAPVTATITATLGSASRAANLTINPAVAPTIDTVSISRAEYDAGKRTLRVEASSTRPTATLQVFVTATNQIVGTLTNNGGRYSAQFNVTANPQNITVRSNGGGQATRAVTIK